jgi:hypothetical protein
MRCTVAPVAGGSDNPDFIMVGAITDTNGQPAQNAIVALVPDSYNPIKDATPDALLLDTTDIHGEYRFDITQKGVYNLQAVHLVGRTRLLITGISVFEDTMIHVKEAALTAPGAVKVFLPSVGINSTTGYIYVPGTSLFAYVNNKTDTTVLDSVPAGIIPVIAYSATNNSTSINIKYNVAVVSGNTTVVSNPLWKYNRKISINTTQAGAGVTGNVYKFPVLIRLNSNNFDFTQTRNDGGDLKFTGIDSVQLPHEIERWDAATNRAEIWVTIDTVFGNNADQSITMYWGNPAASLQTEHGMVFDTAAGFQGVWHLGDAAKDTVRDATLNKYYGISPDSARPPIAEGIIGDCNVFDGTADFITMPNTANSKLNFSQNGYYTVSAWVYLDTLDGVSHCIVSKGYEQYYLRSTYISTNVLNIKPMWEFVEFSESVKWQTSTSPASDKQWSLLVGVRQGDKQLLYCDGILIDSTVDVWQNNVSKNTTNDLSIGKFAKAITVPIIEGYCYFRGGIDEVRILSEAKSPDWVKLCYMNQRVDDRLVVFQ